MVSNWSVLSRFLLDICKVQMNQIWKKEKAALKPDVPKSSPNCCVNMSSFLFHSSFQPLLRHYTPTHTHWSHTHTDWRRVEGVWRNPRPEETQGTMLDWRRRPDISAGILTSSPSGSVVLTLDYSNMCWAVPLPSRTTLQGQERATSTK